MPRSRRASGNSSELRFGELDMLEYNAIVMVMRAWSY